MLSGPLPQQETAKLANESLVFADVDPLVDQMKTRSSMELYTSHCSVSEMSKENTENSPDIFVVERNWQEVSTKTLLVEIKQVWKEEMHLAVSDHMIVEKQAIKLAVNTLTHEDGAKAVKMSFRRKHDVELKEELLDKIIPNDSENCNNWLGNGNSGMDAVAQANPNVHTQLSTGHSKQFEKRAWKFEPISIQLHGMNESAQLNTNGILHANMKADDFTSEISLMETRLGSSKAQTTTSSESGPFIGPAVSREEMMMQRDSFGKCIKEEFRQLEVNDLVWIVDENVKRAHYKMGRVLEVYHGSDGRVRSALVKTEVGKLK